MLVISYSDLFISESVFLLSTEMTPSEYKTIFSSGLNKFRSIEWLVLFLILDNGKRPSLPSEVFLTALHIQSQPNLFCNTYERIGSIILHYCVIKYTMAFDRTLVKDLRESAVKLIHRSALLIDEMLITIDFRMTITTLF